MITIAKQPTQAARDDDQFLNLMPHIARHARRAFRKLRPQEREEALCEVLALAFCAYRRLLELGKQDMAYATPLARYALARHRDGRHVGGKRTSRDVHSAMASRRKGFRLVSLHSIGSRARTWAEMLADDTLTPVPDQVAFRLDFRAWLKRQSRRDRKLAEYLALGNTASEAAAHFRLSRARVSQLRGELRARWETFQGAKA